jgi:hypothetical protein
LQPVKEVAQTAAVIGRAFNHQTIAALLPLPEAELAQAMRRLVEAELIFRRATPPDANYLFKHALVRDAAYESLLKAKRLALHARPVEILESRDDAAPEVIAQHAEEAGLVEKALDYWEQAGAGAVARPAYKEAIAHFNAAIRLCQGIGDRRARQRRELQLQVQLGQALIAHLGYPASDTMTAFERVLELADDIGEPRLLMPSIYGLWASRYIANMPAANLADRLADLTAAGTDMGPRCVALRMLARHAAERTRDLETACDTQAHALVRRQAGDVPALVQHAATIARQRARDAVDQSGLAGTVRANQAKTLALIHMQAHRVKGDEAAKPLAETRHLENALRHGAAASGSDSGSARRCPGAPR